MASKAKNCVLEIPQYVSESEKALKSAPARVIPWSEVKRRMRVIRKRRRMVRR
jgi:hypothetical protein